MRHPSQVYMNINFSTAPPGKLHAHHIVSRWELIPCLWLQRWATFPQAPQEEFSLSNRNVSGTLCFLSQVEWNLRRSDSKEGWISLQWIKFRLIFHLTRWRDVWIHSGYPRESRRSPPHLDRGLTSLWHLKRHTEFTASNVTRPDSSWKFIWIQISLCQLESETRSPASPPEASVLSCQA